MATSLNVQIFQWIHSRAVQQSILDGLAVFTGLQDALLL